MAGSMPRGLLILFAFDAITYIAIVLSYFYDLIEGHRGERSA